MQIAYLGFKIAFQYNKKLETNTKCDAVNSFLKAAFYNCSWPPRLPLTTEQDSLKLQNLVRLRDFFCRTSAAPGFIHSFSLHSTFFSQQSHQTSYYENFLLEGIQ